MAKGRVLLVAAMVVGAGSPAGAAGQMERSATARPADAPNSAEVEALLSTSRIHDIISGMDEAYRDHLRALGLDSVVAAMPELDSAVSAAFADSLVYADVVRFLAARDADDRAARALKRLVGGAVGALDRIPDPQQSFEAFLDSFAYRGPPLERVRLMARWVEIQKAGAFYVLTDQATREAAHTLARRVGATEAEFQPLSREEFAEAYQANMNRAVVSFLWRFQEADEDVVREALDAYGSEAGQWWVQEYTLAVSHAIRQAGLRVAAVLDEEDGP